MAATAEAADSTATLNIAACCCNFPRVVAVALPWMNPSTAAALLTFRTCGEQSGNDTSTSNINIMVTAKLYPG